MRGFIGTTFSRSGSAPMGFFSEKIIASDLQLLHYSVAFWVLVCIHPIHYRSSALMSKVWFYAAGDSAFKQFTSDNQKHKGFSASCPENAG